METKETPRGNGSSKIILRVRCRFGGKAMDDEII